VQIADPPPLVRRLLEAIADHLGLGRGRWRLELVFENGRLADWFRHDERLGPARMDELDPEPPEIPAGY